MRVFKTKWFARFARKEDISDNKLIDAVREAEKGMNDGDLGKGLIKKRVARPGEGKRGGYRTIIVFRVGERAVFVYGFPKSAKANLNAAELDAYQKLAQIYLSFSAASIAKALSEGELEEVNYNGEEISE
ncbi:type II toxin-antitoxin system RelE/ParE family toxin [Desulforhabdus sp. TSK]|uniref:type II toxin-antitoxin system RelE/ParE family toxin n=1 Tax=Desulforhabdus sp. TSK TaxID=2925014 RepID=UPI001FC7BEBD|nr:type II toxin-antitoxin system RelE/ParE family toxin [Desulforhabdus sp. TSK]GKT08976.1 addiction module toxin RelE [Desulforhabdus sp. TSK]